MNANQESDYRRGIVYLIHQGYKLKKLKKIIDKMIEENKTQEKSGVEI